LATVASGVDATGAGTRGCEGRDDAEAITADERTIAMMTMRQVAS
jgi:hypothetical protein